MIFDHYIDGTKDNDILDDGATPPGESTLIGGLGGANEITGTSSITSDGDDQINGSARPMSNL